MGNLQNILIAIIWVTVGMAIGWVARGIEINNMLTFVNKYKGGAFSQNGEASIIDECLRRIKPSLHTAVEFGAPDIYYCSNIYHLSERGWQLHYYDPNPQHPLVNVKTITPENVNELPKCSVLSIDIDGNDYNVWAAYHGHPDIVVVEINSSMKPGIVFSVSDMKNGTDYFSMVELGHAKDYFLLCHTGNLLWVLNKHRHLFPEVIGSPMDNWEDYFNQQWL